MSRSRSTAPDIEPGGPVAVADDATVSRPAAPRSPGELRGRITGIMERIDAGRQQVIYGRSQAVRNAGIREEQAARQELGQLCQAMFDGEDA